MPRIRRGGKRIRGSNGGRTRNADCCCEEDPIVCGDCGMSSSSQFQVNVPGVGTFTLANVVYSAGTNCQWNITQSSGACGTVESVTVLYSSINGGWTVLVQFSNVPGSATYRSATNTQFPGCGPWTVDCPQFFGAFGACAATSVTTYTVTVTLL